MSQHCQDGKAGVCIVCAICQGQKNAQYNLRDTGELSTNWNELQEFSHPKSSQLDRGLDSDASARQDVPDDVQSTSSRLIHTKISSTYQVSTHRCQEAT